MPIRVKGFIFHFIFTDRLSKYSNLKGLKSSLQIMSNYKVKALQPEETIHFLIENHIELEKQFHLFFPDLVEYVRIESILAE